MRARLATAALISTLDAATLFVSQVMGPFPSVVPLGDPTAYRNLYIHVPVSVATYVLFTLGFAFALAFLVRGSESAERAAHSFILAGLVAGAATLATGMVWASESWGSPWNWDPRETGVLFMFLAFTVYLAVRSSVKDPDVRPRVSMAFAAAAYSTVPLSFVVPYAMPSLHPVAPETAAFVHGGLTAILFASRTALISAEAVLLAASAGRGGIPIYVAAPVVLAALAVAALQLPPSLAGTDPRAGEFKALVVSGEAENGTLRLRVAAEGEELDLEYRGDPPIRPLTVQVGGEEVLTLRGHWILVRGRLEGGIVMAEDLRLVPYWGNPINSLIYAAVPLGLARLSREGAA